MSYSVKLSSTEKTRNGWDRVNDTPLSIQQFSKIQKGKEIVRRGVWGVERNVGMGCASMWSMGSDNVKDSGFRKSLEGDQKVEVWRPVRVVWSDDDKLGMAVAVEVVDVGDSSKSAKAPGSVMK